MNEQDQTQKETQKQEQAAKPETASEELNEQQLDEVNGGGGHVKVFDGRTSGELRS